MSVCVPGRIEKVLEPGSAGNSGRIEPVRLNLKKLFVQALDLLWVDAAGGEIVHRNLAQLPARRLKTRNVLVEAFQWYLLLS